MEEENKRIKEENEKLQEEIEKLRSRRSLREAHKRIEVLIEKNNIKYKEEKERIKILQNTKNLCEATLKANEFLKEKLSNNHKFILGRVVPKEDHKDFCDAFGDELGINFEMIKYGNEEDDAD